MNTDFYKGWTPAAKLAFDKVYGIAAGLGAVAIVPLRYFSSIGGSEFLTYNVNKLYFCFQFCASASTGGATTQGIVQLYDEGNVLASDLHQNSAYWDTTAAVVKYYPNNATHNNFYFSRIVVNTYSRMIFIGYRLEITP